MLWRSSHVLLVVIGVSSVLACNKKAAPTTAAVPMPEPSRTEEGGRSLADSIARADAARRDSIARAERLRVDRDAAARAAFLAPVYFAYDAAALSDQARRVLDAKLPLLRTTPDLRLRISGHADDRGSDEYNLALGQRRAVEVKRYFSDHGVDASQLEVVTFGEELPVCTGEEESCWARNRRAEFEVTAGLDRSDR